MTEEELISDFPNLYHMAEGGSWSSIQKHGLLSTTMLLDLYGYTGQPRQQIEQHHRPNSVLLIADDMPRVVVRDQKPMSDAGLRRALPDDILPAEWYALLNAKTFFWTSESRLLRLLSARAYRDTNHDVLTVNTEQLVNRYGGDIFLCPINSGCTKPFPHPRDRSAFLPIRDYPYEEWKKRRPKWDSVVEVAVEGGIPDILQCTVKVSEMHGDQVIRTIWPEDAL